METAESGGLRYQWKIEGKRPLNILQSIGNGCAFLDFDQDGNLDILLVGPRPALFQGNGHGHFTEVTQAAGLDTLNGHFLGCAVGDYDNDGYPDIYLSAYQGGALLHNEWGQGKRKGRNIRTDSIENRKSKIENSVARHAKPFFKDVTAQAGLKAQPWGTSCAFADMDSDGRLDLYIGNYVRFGPKTGPQLCNSHGVLTSCGPGDYAAERGMLYRNRGGGRFRDVTRDWGFEAVSGRALGVAAAPVADVRYPALAIANDQTPGDLMQWQGRNSKNIGVVSGMAYFSGGSPYGGMGIDWGDYDNDSRLDLVIATYQNQAKCLFHNQDGAFAMQDTTRLGMFSSVPYVAFGVKWLDVDNDGWLDLLFANGHVQDNIAEVDVLTAGSPGAAYRQPLMLYLNQQGQRFQDAGARLDSGAQRPLVGRGLAAGDYDNDGRMDALAVDSEGRPQLLHNVTLQAGHWLLVQLTGRKSNRDGYGARLTLQAGGQSLIRHCHADGSYLSSSDKRIHFGLGKATRVDRLLVQWPDGQQDVFVNIPGDQILSIQEAERSRVAPVEERL